MHPRFGFLYAQIQRGFRARRTLPRGFAADLGHRDLKDRGEGAEGLQPRAFAILNALDRADAETRHFGQLLLGPGAL